MFSPLKLQYNANPLLCKPILRANPHLLHAAYLQNPHKIHFLSFFSLPDQYFFSFKGETIASNALLRYTPGDQPQHKPMIEPVSITDFL